MTSLRLFPALAVAFSILPARADDAKAPPASAYFLRHADDPVRWQQWGPEAFEKARKEKKPIYLSIGYDASHQCALMQEESFRDPEIAALLNRHFVNVLVDRVQRPDLEGLYQIYQGSSGGSGWPVNVWITPEGTPFSVGGYFPPVSSDDAIPTFTKVIQHISTQWARFPDYINEQSKRDFERLRNSIAAADTGKDPDAAPAPESPALATLAYEALAATFDPVAGGFTNPAKHPRGASLQFLTLFAAGEPTDGYRQGRIRKMLALTATAIAKGGLCDHLGGGFYRNTVDVSWQLPRFEKMLGVQSEVALALLDLHAFAPDPLYAETIRHTLDFTLRDLRLPSGLFQTSLASDSKSSPDAPAAVEGAYYTWSYDDFAATLDPKDLPVLAEVFQIRRGGNLDPGATRSAALARTNVLRRSHNETGLAERFGLTEEEWKATLARGVESLFQARARRPRPSLDSATPTASNAAMASAFARSARVLGHAPDLAVARDCLAALLASRLDASSGRLYHLDAQGGGVFALSYATTIRALLDLYDATLDPRHLETAATLQTRQNEFFGDEEKGGYFETLADAPDMLIRLKSFATEPEADTNGISAANLRRLGDLLDDASLLERGRALHLAFRPRVAQAPHFAPALMADALLLEEEPVQILLGAETPPALADGIFRYLHAHPRLRASVFTAAPGFLVERNARLREALAAPADAGSFRVGRGFVFGPPLTSADALPKALGQP